MTNPADRPLIVLGADAQPLTFTGHVGVFNDGVRILGADLGRDERTAIALLGPDGRVLESRSFPVTRALHVEPSENEASFWDPTAVCVGPAHRFKAPDVDPFADLPTRDVSELPPPVRRHLFDAIKVALFAYAAGYRPTLH